MTFEAGLLLWLLAAIPLLLLFLVSRERFRAMLGRRFASERLRGVSLPARWLRPWVLAAGVALAIVALAGPYAGVDLVPIVTNESNRVLVIDVSNSMAAADVGTSRIAAARALAMRLAAEQQGRVALIAFEAAAEVISPLTSDGDAVATLIQTLAPGEIGQPGSDIGGAVIAALRLIESDPVQAADVVVISDGEDQTARIAEAVARARGRNVGVSAILVGTAGGSTIPTARGPLRDDSGEVVTTYARSAPLRNLAAETQGTFLENPFGATSLDPLLRGGSGSARETHARVPVHRFQWPLSVAFFLILGASFLNRGAE